jgi:predicted lipoprotein with Yx(FWY)xxD motif/plastocyanin
MVRAATDGSSCRQLVIRSTARDVDASIRPEPGRLTGVLPMTSSRHLTTATRIAGLAAVAAILVAACSSGSAATATPSTAAGPPSPTASAAASGAASTYTVAVANDATLGMYLTGEGGKTLYLLTTDQSGTSTCTGACATAWPPFTLAPGETVTGGSGVTGTFATLTRDDGSMQVTYDGVPLYYFAADTAAGDTNGQGVKGVWFVVTPDGKPDEAGVASPSPSPAASDGALGAQATIVDFDFSPASITVGVGGTVTWKNTGTRNHTVTADDGSFDSGSLASGATFTETFTKAGSYTYHCSIHPSMTATVVVGG